MTTVIAPSLGAGIDFTQLGTGTSPGYSAIDIRRADMGGPLQQGIGSTNGGDYAVAQRAAGANMSVDIASTTGYFLVQGNSVTFQGLYTAPPHNAVINEAIAASDPTNPRIDQVFLQIWDSTHDASGLNQAATTVLTGTPTPGATLANRSGAAAAPTNGVRLADILVSATSTTVTTANIRDRRSWARGAFSRQAKTNANASSSSGTQAVIDAATLQVRLECSGLPVRAILQCIGDNSTSGDGAATGLFVDGAGADSSTSLGSLTSPVANNTYGGGYVYTTTPAAGSHLFAPTLAFTGAGTAVIVASAGQPATFVVEELVRGNSNNGTA